MLALAVTVILAALISALCSTTEAMLYSVPWTHIEKMKEQGRPVGKVLFELRTQIDKPISAVLTLNTIANTAGSALAGALASVALGAENLIWFTIAFTILILIVGEIVPKTFGVIYASQISILLAYPLKGLMYAFSPFIYMSSFITSLITKNSGSPKTTEDDIRIMARMSAQSGTIEAFEETVITNILSFDKKTVHDVMTPRTVVFSLPADTLLRDAFKDKKLWHFSRIPVYKNNNEDIIGLVTRRDLSIHMTALSIEAQETGGDCEKIGKSTESLESIMQPISFVLEGQSLDKILLHFLNTRQHLAAVLDEYGGLAGVISLEDVLEEMLGREIVDESDIVADLRKSAKDGAKYSGKVEKNSL